MSHRGAVSGEQAGQGLPAHRHIESNSRLCMASAGTGYKQSLGADGPPGSYTDFDRADLFFVIGSNMADCHPILFLRMADRVKAGAKLIVVDPRRTATAQQGRPVPADQTRHRPRPAERAAAPARRKRRHRRRFHRRAHRGLGRRCPRSSPTTRRDRVAEITGIPEADIRAAARMIADAGEWMSCWTMGLNQSTHGTWNTNAICNLHLATGAICRPGSGPMSLTGQPNAMGGREMGYMGPGLPGQRSVLSAADREFVEEQWGLAAGHDPRRRRPRHRSTMFEQTGRTATSRRAGSSAPIPLPPWRIGRPSSPGWRPPSSSSPRTPISRHRDQRLRRHRAARRRCGRSPTPSWSTPSAT